MNLRNGNPVGILADSAGEPLTTESKDEISFDYDII